jgi:hypothetical protein
MIPVNSLKKFFYKKAVITWYVIIILFIGKIDFFRFNMSKISSEIDLGYTLWPFPATANTTGILLLSGVLYETF